MAAKSKKRRLKPKFRKLFTLVALATAFVGAVWVGNTLAYLVANPNAVANDFSYSEVACAVIEESSGATKYNVQIQNTGDTTAYIRAYILVTWKDTDGNVNGVTTPTVDTDYTIDYGSDWTNIGDYYYYNSEVEPTKLTAVLIESCTYAADVAIPSGYGLSVEIIADAIQSAPVDAAQEAWSVDFSNGTPVEVK